MNPLHWPVRMHIASVGVSKFCFLFSLVFCGLLLLLIPALQPPARQVDLPQPRPQVRPTHASPSHHAGVPVVSVHVGELDSATGLNRSSAVPRGSIEADITRNDNHSHKKGMDSQGGALHGGNGGRLSGSRSEDLLELKDIFIAVKTTRKYHKSRLELLIHTWVSQAKEQTYIFTDGEDKELLMRTDHATTVLLAGSPGRCGALLVEMISYNTLECKDKTIFFTKNNFFCVELNFLPGEETRLNQWVLNMRRKKWTPSGTSISHFTLQRAL